MKHSIPAIVGGTPIRKTYLTFGAPDIGKKEIAHVVESLRIGWLSTGPKVGQFEQEVCRYLGARWGKAVNSATAAMHLSLLVSSIGPGDEVITTPLTFASTANVILHVGATPIFVDVDKATGLINESLIRPALTKKTKAIVPVHLYGRPCEMDIIMRYAKQYHLTVVEDAAHAFGARYKGKSIGTVGDFTCFSFYVTKNIVTGEGGMVTTSKKSQAALIEKYALHGMSRGAWRRYSDTGYKHYLIEVPGYKYNMMDIQAGIGLAQLDRFDAMQKKRQDIWNRYMRELSDLPLTLPSRVPTHMTHALHLFTILVSLERLKASRDRIVEALHQEGIGTGIHFIALHLHPYYKKRFSFERSSFPNARFISDRTISLPLSSRLAKEDVSDVIAGVKKVLTYYYKPQGRIQKRI